MTTQLRWIVSQSVSCLHAVDAIARGWPIVDERLNTQLIEPATALLHEIDAAGFVVPTFLRHLVPLADGIDNNHQLAARAATKSAGLAAADEIYVGRIAGRIAEVEAAVRRAYPMLVDDMTLRAGPLREQWEARGPGFLKHAAQLTDERLLVPNADVLVVHPALGGGGVAHLPYNSVRIEAVLANPVPQIPEAVRLGWLLAQLNCDRPAFCENILADRLPLVAQLALLPIALAAGEYVELTRCDAATMELALQTWHFDTKPDRRLAEAVVEWWGTYQETRPRWDVALVALDRMTA